MSLFTLLILTLAAAQTNVAPPLAGTRITKPEWVSRPSGSQMYDALSHSARAEDVAGWAVIKCEVTAKGTLTRCVTLVESPLKYEFGKSALRIASMFRMKPATRDGQPVEGGTVLIPVVFGSMQMGAAKTSYAPGRPSFLVKPITEKKTGATVIGCPNGQNPPTACEAKEIYWSNTPSLEETAPIILESKQSTGVSTVFCKFSEAKAFENCQMEGEKGPGALAAVGKTLSKLKAPRTMQGDLVTSAIVALVYDWSTLTKVAEAIIAAEDQPAGN